MKRRRNCFILCVILLLTITVHSVIAAEPRSADGVSPSQETAWTLERTIVYISEMGGIVGVPLEEHVDNVFNEIGRDENALLVFKMNTPGGLVDSMSGIITKIAEADFPVVVWVAPSGARAASAGAFIVQAAHVAAMAPGTNIGAAHPVTGGGKGIDDDEMKRKVTNDLTAKIRSFAQERSRDVETAESMVAESISLTAREALDKNIIDFIAASEKELFDQLNGRTVLIKGEARRINLENHEIRRLEMGFRLRALSLFSRPDIAYLALIAGVFLILLEAKSPGGFVMGVTGGILLIIASYGLRVLPVNLAGVALLVGGIVIVILDLLIGGMGIIAAAGIGAMLFGGLILFRAPGGELLNLSAGFIVGVTLVLAVLFLLVLRLIYKALRKRPSSGMEALIGMRLKITGSTEKNLMTFVHGEYWRVMPIDQGVDLAVGDEVVVIAVESLMLYVKPFDGDGKIKDRGAPPHPSQGD